MRIGFGSPASPAEGSATEHEINTGFQPGRGIFISRIAFSPGEGLTKEDILPLMPGDDEDPFQSSYPEYFYYGGKKHDHYCDVSGHVLAAETQILSPEIKQSSLGASLRLAERAHFPTVWHNFSDEQIVADSRASLSDGSLVDAALSRNRVATYHNDSFIYPGSRQELEQITTAEDMGFVVLDVDLRSPTIAGLRKALSGIYEKGLTVARYTSEAGKSVLPFHTDVKSVLAVQVEGKKDLSLP